ncbi:MAG: hypothetical protein CMO12_01540 [Thaumarchaeota archaeon]|nr:hypothetical protein [Nitrososphaerota archaeon]
MCNREKTLQVQKGVRESHWELIGGILAVLAALSFALTLIALKKALQTTSSLTVTIASVAPAAIIFVPAVIFLAPPHMVSLNTIVVLIVAGLMAPTSARFFRFMAVDKMGVAPAAPIGGTSALFSAVIAAAVLGEVITVQIGIGTLAVVAGVIILSLGEGKTQLSKAGVTMALISAVTFGGASVARKIGVEAASSPLLGAAIGATVATISYAILASATNQTIDHPRSWNRFTYATAIFSSVSLIFIFSALFLERVVIVQPLLSTSPLYQLLFSWIFLKKVEHVSSSIVIAGITVVLGSILVVTG